MIDEHDGLPVDGLVDAGVMLLKFCHCWSMSEILAFTGSAGIGSISAIALREFSDLWQDPKAHGSG